jgi:yeast amino acid transporter
MEKEDYHINQGSPEYGDRRGSVKDVVEQKGGAIGEAADIYGDVQTAEELGYVSRG